MTQASAARPHAARDALRKAEISRIEKESGRHGPAFRRGDALPGRRVPALSLPKYTDIRLVFAPEQAAFFGGDPDNFTFPRYDLDFASFASTRTARLAPRAFLEMDRRGAADGDSSSRPVIPPERNGCPPSPSLSPRDIQRPILLSYVWGRVAVLRAYAATGPEAARQAQDLIFGLENSRKAFEGELEGLQQVDHGEEGRRRARFATCP